MEIQHSRGASATQSTTLHSLSNELIALIFEALLQWDLPSEEDHFGDWDNLPPSYINLPSVRLVCKVFDRLATPLRYRTYTLIESTEFPAIRPQPRNVREQVALNIKRYTEHVIVRGNVDWHRIVHNYQSFPRLKTISLKFFSWWKERVIGRLRNYCHVPESMLRSGVSVSISAIGDYWDLTRYVPPEYIVSLSLKMMHPTFPENVHGARDANKYILLAKNLKSLSYDLTQMRWWTPYFLTFLPEERMPALESLALISYHWKHTKNDIQSIWDFSKLQNLDIRGMNHHEFFSTVNAKWFSNLETLRLGSFDSREPSHMQRPVEQTLLHTFLRNVPQLKKLYMTSYTRDFPLDVLMAMENLEVLEFTEQVEILRGTLSYPRLAMTDLKELLQYLPHLRQLHIDLETWTGYFKQVLLDVFAPYPALRRVDINSHGNNTDPSDDFTHLLPEEPHQSATIVTLHHWRYHEKYFPWDYEGCRGDWESDRSTTWVVPKSS
ncbi:hypothetical protein VTL71DRAFT_15670 [Oculimacula yallundae]|uniref:F-box domain-containing protein n=1 Tax=Oculimacula yallundae TaxID=86028 RepID=A0ABR4CIL6_9HELO